MNVAVMGTGSLASLFAARLAPLVDVTMVGSWPQQLKAIASGGLRLEQLDGRTFRYRVLATSSTEDLPAAELALILVKSWQTERAAHQASRLLASDGLALTLQNGLGNLDTIASSVGVERAVLGVTSEGAMMIEPGLVRHSGAGETHLAATPRTIDRLSSVAGIFGAAGFRTELVANANSLVWGKLAVSAGINPLSALLQVSNGYLVEHEASRFIACRAAEETAAVAQAQGIELPYSSAAERVLQVARATAANLSSMAQDVARGAPTEIDSISGAIVRIGEAFDVETPINRSLLTLVSAKVETGEWRSSLPQVNRLVRESLVQLGAAESGT